MERRELGWTPISDDPPRQEKSDDFEGQVNGSGTNSDDRVATAPPYGVDDTPPSSPPGTRGK